MSWHIGRSYEFPYKQIKKNKTKQKKYVKQILVKVVNFVIKIKFIYQITILNKKLKPLNKILNYNLYYSIIHTF
jgi:hypothetical protein